MGRSSNSRGASEGSLVCTNTNFCMLEGTVKHYEVSRTITCQYFFSLGENITIKRLGTESTTTLIRLARDISRRIPALRTNIRAEINMNMRRYKPTTAFTGLQTILYASSEKTDRTWLKQPLYYPPEFKWLREICHTTGAGWHRGKRVLKNPITLTSSLRDVKVLIFSEVVVGE